MKCVEHTCRRFDRSSLVKYCRKLGQSVTGGKWKATDSAVIEVTLNEETEATGSTLDRWRKYRVF